MKLVGILSLIILGLLGYSGFITYKYNNTKPTIITNTVVIPGDIRYRDTIIYKPIPYQVIVPIHDTMYIPKDSAQCVEDYKKLYRDYTTPRFYRDTLQNDSSMTIITDAVTNRNELSSLQLRSKNNREKSIITTTVTYPDEPKLSIGLISGQNESSPFIMYEFNNKFGLVGGYNILDKSVGIVPKLKIGLKYTLLSKKRK